jgi:hypothetical protein
MNDDVPLLARLWADHTPWIEGPALTPRITVLAETEADIRFPEDLLRILKTRNGGALRYDAYPWRNPPGEPAGTVRLLRVTHLRGLGGPAGLTTPARLKLPAPADPRLWVWCAEEEHAIAIAPHPEDEDQWQVHVLFPDGSLHLLTQTITAFVEHLTRSDDVHLIAIEPLPEEDFVVDETADTILDLLTELQEDVEGDELEPGQLWELTLPMFSDREGHPPARVFVRRSTGDWQNPELPEVPRARMVLEADCGTRVAEWLTQSLCQGGLRATLVHSPISAS